MKRYPHRRALCCVVAGIVLAGCATTVPVASYYLLTGSHSGTVQSHSSGAVAVYVRRADVPPYLAKPGLVTINGGIEATYAETGLWAEPLDQGLSRAVAEDLSQSPRIRAFAFSPSMPPSDHSYDVSIRLERFEGTDDGQVILRARWSISMPDSSVSIAGRTTEIRRAGWKPGNYAGLVHLLRAELKQFAREISRAIP